MPVRFRDIVKPEHYNTFRWQFFRVHFQFVMANQRPHPYDFFMIVCGPVPLKERMAFPEAALEVATGNPAAREQAWRQIEMCGAEATPGGNLLALDLPPAGTVKNPRLFNSPAWAPPGTQPLCGLALPSALV